MMNHNTVIIIIQAEKRFYQLELMNREKNYNKLFNAKPCIGVLDPLQAHVSKLIINVNAQYHASSSINRKRNMYQKLVVCVTPAPPPSSPLSQLNPRQRHQVVWATPSMPLPLPKAQSLSLLTTWPH